MAAASSQRNRLAVVNHLSLRHSRSASTALRSRRGERREVPSANLREVHIAEIPGSGQRKAPADLQTPTWRRSERKPSGAPRARLRHHASLPQHTHTHRSKAPSRVVTCASREGSCAEASPSRGARCAAPPAAKGQDGSSQWGRSRWAESEPVPFR